MTILIIAAVWLLLIVIALLFLRGADMIREQEDRYWDDIARAGASSGPKKERAGER